MTVTQAPFLRGKKNNKKCSFSKSEVRRQQQTFVNTRKNTKKHTPKNKQKQQQQKTNKQSNSKSTKASYHMSHKTHTSNPNEETNHVSTMAGDPESLGFLPFSSSRGNSLLSSMLSLYFKHERRMSEIRREITENNARADALLAAAEMMASLRESVGGAAAQPVSTSETPRESANERLVAGEAVHHGAQTNDNNNSSTNNTSVNTAGGASFSIEKSFRAEGISQSLNIIASSSSEKRLCFQHDPAVGTSGLAVSGQPFRVISNHSGVNTFNNIFSKEDVATRAGPQYNYIDSSLPHSSSHAADHPSSYGGVPPDASGGLVHSSRFFKDFLNNLTPPLSQEEVVGIVSSAVQLASRADANGSVDTEVIGNGRDRASDEPNDGSDSAEMVPIATPNAPTLGLMLEAFNRHKMLRKRDTLMGASSANNGQHEFARVPPATASKPVRLGVRDVHATDNSNGESSRTPPPLPPPPPPAPPRRTGQPMPLSLPPTFQSQPYYSGHQQPFRPVTPSQQVASYIAHVREEVRTASLPTAGQSNALLPFSMFLLSQRQQSPQASLTVGHHVAASNSQEGRFPSPSMPRTHVAPSSRAVVVPLQPLEKKPSDREASGQVRALPVEGFDPSSHAPCPASDGKGLGGVACVSPFRRKTTLTPLAERATREGAYARTTGMDGDTKAGLPQERPSSAEGVAPFDHRHGRSVSSIMPPDNTRGILCENEIPSEPPLAKPNAFCEIVSSSKETPVPRSPGIQVECTPPHVRDAFDALFGNESKHARQGLSDSLREEALDEQSHLLVQQRPTGPCLRSAADRSTVAGIIAMVTSNSNTNNTAATGGRGSRTIGKEKHPKALLAESGAMKRAREAAASEDDYAEREGPRGSEGAQRGRGKAPRKKAAEPECTPAEYWEI